jgi:two-component system, NarL family, sensor kinase
MFRRGVDWLLDRPVIALALAGLASLLVIAAVAFSYVRSAGRSEAVDEAKRITSIAGHGVIEPALSDALLSGKPDAIAKMDRLVRTRLESDIVRIKIWAPNGTIVYSDEKHLIGKKFQLGADELTTLFTGEDHADVSDLSAPENVYERQAGRQLLEVYTRIDTKDGQHLLFEAYLPFDSVAASASRIWQTFLPVVIGAIVLLYLALLPIAWVLASRLRAGHREREALLRRAIEAADRERRQIASDLHDGVVQDLAGLAFELEAAARSGDEVDLAVPAAQVRRSVRDLRGLLVEIYPPNLRRAGLARAVQDLASSLEPRTVVTSIEIPEGAELSEGQEALIYRAAQEGLRNAYRHASASRVTVRLDEREGIAVLTVEDDGVGVDPNELERRRRRGHLGLAALDDLARDAGGRLLLEPAGTRGTRLCLELPR